MLLCMQYRPYLSMPLATKRTLQWCPLNHNNTFFKMRIESEPEVPGSDCIKSKSSRISLTVNT